VFDDEKRSLGLYRDEAVDALIRVRVKSDAPHLIGSNSFPPDPARVHIQTTRTKLGYADEEDEEEGSPNIASSINFSTSCSLNLCMSFLASPVVLNSLPSFALSTWI
jgi:hypothetical protein